MAHPDTAGFTGRIALGLLIGLGAALAHAQPLDRAADALLAIDQHRASVVERIVDSWGPPLAKSSAYVSIDELRARLLALRADRLLAASLAGTLDGLRDVIGVEAPSAILAKPGLAPTKALGDSTGDVVYTPVTPCRLVETRGTFAAVYQGNGTVAHTPVPFAPNQIRSYTVQGGNGVCPTSWATSRRRAAAAANSSSRAATRSAPRHSSEPSRSEHRRRYPVLQPATGGRELAMHQ